MSSQEQHIIRNDQMPNRTADERDACIIKLKMERHKLTRKLNDLEKQIQIAHHKVKDMVHAKNKDQAIYYLAKKKAMTQNLNNYNKRILLIENRAREMENVMDDLKFTKLLEESNNELKNLLDEVNYEAIHEAKELSQEVDMNNRQVQEIINDHNHDEDILAEFNMLGNEDFNLETSNKNIQRNSNEIIQNNNINRISNKQNEEMMMLA